MTEWDVGYIILAKADRSRCPIACGWVAGLL